MKKFAERETTKKYYFADNGVLSLFLGNPENRLLENIVACELVRRGHVLQFAKGRAEVDFVLPEENMAIQACLSVNDPATLRRECKSMIEINKTVKAEKLLIITVDEERAIEYEGSRVEITPVWKRLIRER
jgi:predicted AAA+ superfamily ATPase